MKSLSIFANVMEFGTKMIFFLLIEVISLAYMAFRVISAIAKIVFYGVKLSLVKHHYRKTNIKSSQKKQWYKD